MLSFPFSFFFFFFFFFSKSLPARVTINNMRMTNSSGWNSSRTPAFDLWFLSNSSFVAFSSSSTIPVSPIESYLTTRIATNVTNVISLVIPSSASNESQVYVAIDNRPFGGRAPLPGATVTVSWDDFQWITGTDVTRFSNRCGQRTIHTGPNQAMFGDLNDASLLSSRAVGSATIISSTGTAQYAAYVFDQANRDAFLATGAFSINGTNGVACQNGTACSLPVSGPAYLVLGASGSGSVTYRYAMGDGVSGMCSPSSTPSTTTTATTTSTTTSTVTPATNATTTTSAATTTTTTTTTAAPTTTAPSTTTATTTTGAANSTTTQPSSDTTATTATDGESSTTASTDNASTAGSETSGGSDSATGSVASTSAGTDDVGLASSPLVAGAALSIGVAAACVLF
jgi:hypothetical protein